MESHAPTQIRKTPLPRYINEGKDVQQALLWLLEFAMDKLAKEGERYEEALKHGDNKNLRAIGQTMTSLIPQTLRVLDLLRESIPAEKEEEEDLATLLAKIPDELPWVKTEKEAKKVVKLIRSSSFSKTRIP